MEIVPSRIHERFAKWCSELLPVLKLQEMTPEGLRKGRFPDTGGQSRPEGAKRSPSRKIAYMFISHDLRVVRALSNHVIVMKDDKVVVEGSSRDVFERPQMPQTQALLATALNLEVRFTGAIAD